MDSTNIIVAWWGAVVATLVLIWDVVKWSQSGPKIKYRYQINTWYLDGEVLEEKDEDDVVSKICAEYCHIELVNTGIIPTTIMSVWLSNKHLKNETVIGMGDKNITEHFGKKLPYSLAPGDIWSCRISMDKIKQVKNYGWPFVAFDLSHLDKALEIKIDL